MKTPDNWALMMSAAKQYYQLGLSQDVIAKNLYVSKSTVSRLIKKAVELGYIEFKINNFSEADEALQHEFLQTYGIPCHILPSLVDSELVRLNDVCAFAAEDIFSHLEDGEIIGVPWGQTIEYLAANILEPIDQYRDLKVCMINGFINGSIRSMRAIHIVEKLSSMLNATGYVMPCPLLVADQSVKRALLSDPSIRQISDLIQNVSTVIFSVGLCDLRNPQLRGMGIDAADQLEACAGAGNLAGRTYDIDGVEIETNLYHRLMSPRLATLAGAKKRLCIAVGDHKARPVLGLLRGGFITRLYTDTQTARAILKEHKNLSACNRNGGPRRGA